MRRAIALAVALLIATWCPQQAHSAPHSAAPPANPQQAASSQKVVVHLSHFTEDLHRCFMALKLATLMQQHGAQVTLFVDLEGVRLAAGQQDLKFTWGTNPKTLGEVYAEFVAAGGQVLVCPHCAMSANIDKLPLKQGAKIGDMEGMARMLLDADKIMDY